MSYIETARRLRPIIERAAQSLDDQTASAAPALFQGMRYDGGLISAGTKIQWNGVVKKALVDLWDEETNNPDNAPTLWTEITYREGIRLAPAVFTAENAAKLDELMWFGSEVYRSLMDGNVYTPQQSPDVWERVK